jgi:hypothetical protein
MVFEFVLATRRSSKMVKPEDKEIYRLWWEYVKRSERYKAFLEENRGKISWAKALAVGLNEPLYFTALIFGDVHAERFEDWWERGINNPMFHIKPDPAGEILCIKDASEEILSDISLVYNLFRLRNDDQEPNEYELIDAFRDRMQSLSGWGKIRIEVNLHIPTEELVKEFRAYVSQKRKEYETREFAMQLKGIQGQPTRDKLRDELWKYLNVYDLRMKGASYVDIVRQIGTPAEKEGIKKMDSISKRQSNPQDINRMYRRYFQKAKRIIRNTEQGCFPGDYSD